MIKIIIIVLKILGGLFTLIGIGYAVEIGDMVAGKYHLSTNAYTKKRLLMHIRILCACIVLAIIFTVVPAIVNRDLRLLFYILAEIGIIALSFGLSSMLPSKSSKIHREKRLP